ncbi:hypothetical protein [Garciella nitratireducens]|uniref:hypothetical protein n=1 Tax=Garciella nitratireducens TaxID=218205 RepID=UPI000DEA8479|nr:hypothetical protein [Garciella nitratireducens]
MESKSILLSNIGRALKEDILIKKDYRKGISRNLSSFDETNQFVENYIDTIQPFINDNTIFCIDGSEITKRNSKVLEDIGTVRDGSTGETNVNGYNILEVAALNDKYKMPISAYSKVYSNACEDFKSENTETLKALDFIRTYFGNVGIKALDRGYDDNKFYKYFTKNEEQFVIRAKRNRDVIDNGKVINILNLANKYKGRYVTIMKNKAGKARKCKFSYIPISLPAIPDEKLTLIIIRGGASI